MDNNKFILVFDGHPIAVTNTEDGAHHRAIAHSLFTGVANHELYSIYEVPYIVQ